MPFWLLSKICEPANGGLHRSLRNQPNQTAQGLMAENGFLQALRFQQFLFLLQGSLRLEPCIRKLENAGNPTECCRRDLQSLGLVETELLKRCLMRVGGFHGHFDFKWKPKAKAQHCGPFLQNGFDARQPCFLVPLSLVGVFFRLDGR